MSRIANFCDWLLRSPILWGVMAWMLSDTLVRRFGGEWLNGYFTETPLHRITTALFLVGVAALVLRGLSVASQFGVLRRPLLDPIVPGGQPVTDTIALADSLNGLPEWLRKTYLVQRLENALDHVSRRQSADALEEHLRTLEEDDYSRMSSGYAMVRVVTAVVPILGFLGTVVGITLAIANLSPTELESSLTDVIGGLSVAFDTTALALALSIVLLFAKLGVEALEDRLLMLTGRRAYQELIGRFEQHGGATDPHVATISRMCDQVVRAVEVMAARQADLWKTTVDETNEQWAKATSTAGRQLTDAVASGLQQSLEDHASGLAKGVESQLVRLNDGLSGQAETLAGAVASQVTAMSKSIDAQVAALNQAVEKQGASLNSGAAELLGNLRNGLERMAELLVEALEKHGRTLTQAEEELASENRRHLSEVEAALGEAMVVAADRQEKLIGRSEGLLRDVQSSLAKSADATVAQQEQLVKQGEVLLGVVESTGQVRALEDALNQNLAALGRGLNLEETLMSLSAAIQLLAARSGRPATDSGPSTSQAA